jgi:hypothetical protein
LEGLKWSAFALIASRGILSWGLGRKSGSVAPALKRGFASGE